MSNEVPDSAADSIAGPDDWKKRRLIDHVLEVMRSSDTRL
jgi:hypothetical protein